MGLLSQLTEKLRFWWNPRWELNYSYEIHMYGKDPLFTITRGKYKNHRFFFTNVSLRDAEDGSGEGILTFDIRHQNGTTPRKVTDEILTDFTKHVIDNYNELHREVLHDKTEDTGTDYFEEPVDERRVRPPRTSVPKE